MFKKILVAQDGSAGGARAFERALELAAEGDSKIEMLSVIEDLPRYAEASMSEVDDRLEHARRHFEFLQEGAAAGAARRGVKVHCHIVPGHAVEAIVQLAEQEHADLIAIGGLGHSRILRRASGGAGSQIAYHASCSVLVVR